MSDVEQEAAIRELAARSQALLDTLNAFMVAAAPLAQRLAQTLCVVQATLPPLKGPLEMGIEDIVRRMEGEWDE